MNFEQLKKTGNSVYEKYANDYSTGNKKMMDEYIKMVQNDCCILNNLLARLRDEAEIKLIPDELKIVMRFNPLFEDLHIDVDGNILKKV